MINPLNGEVTLQMHNNLKKVINNTGDEINKFANKY